MFAAKFRYAIYLVRSWFEPDSVTEFGFYGTIGIVLFIAWFGQ